MDKIYRSIAAGLIAALFAVVVAQAQTYTPTPGVPLGGSLRSTDLLLVSRSGVTTNAAWPTSPSLFPTATSTTLGIVKPGSGMTVDGTGALNVTLTSGSITSAIGTTATANPAINGSPTSGFYTPGTNVIGIELNAVKAMAWNTLSSGVDYLSITPGKSGTNPLISVNGSTANQGLSLTGTGTGSVSVNGLVINSSHVVTTGVWNGTAIGSAYMALGSSTSPGAVQVDGTTITASGGVISASGSAPSLSSLVAASTTNTIANGANAQVWNFTNTTQTAMKIASNALTTGKVLDIENSSGGNSAGYAGYFANATTGAGYALYGTATGASNTGYGVYGIDDSANGYGGYFSSTSGKALYANGAAYFSGTTTIVTAKVTGGNIDGTTIGATTSAAGTFSTITVGSCTGCGATGLTYLTSTTTSGGGQISFGSAWITSTYHSYLIQLDNLSQSGGNTLGLLFSTDNCVTPITTNYYWNGYYQGHSTSLIGGSAGGSVAASIDLEAADTAAISRAGGSITIYNPGASQYPSVNYELSGYDGTGALTVKGSGFYNVSGAVNCVIIKPSAGTLTANARLYGYN